MLGHKRKLLGHVPGCAGAWLRHCPRRERNLTWNKHCHMSNARAQVKVARACAWVCRSLATALSQKREKFDLEQTLPHVQTQLFELQTSNRNFPTLNLSGCSSTIVNYTVHKYCCNFCIYAFHCYFSLLFIILIEIVFYVPVQQD